MPAAPFVSLWPDPESLGTLTDLYELTMMAGYAAEGMAEIPATFELFVRNLPQNRAYLVFAGLEQAIEGLLRLRFSEEQVNWLRAHPSFSGIDDGWFDHLRSLRFAGDVWAIPEGTVAFPGEPLVRVEAPIEQAQWVETFLINAIAYPTMVASKAARVIEAASGRSVVEFGARRGHGPMAPLLAARSAYIAGFDGTSHVEAARRLGIPAVGTMAHSWVQSFGDECAAFEAFSRHFGGTATMLVDTYETLGGVRRAAAIEPPIQGVRLDSGDLLQLSRGARAILDASDRAGVRIVASGDLDEWAIARLVQNDAPIDVFGVGTEVITSRDAPSIGMVYKLVAIDGEGRIKLSKDKASVPLAKQVFRRRDERGLLLGDLVARCDETHPGEPLLAQVVRDGSLVRGMPRLDVIRAHRAEQVAALPEGMRELDPVPLAPVSMSDALRLEAERLRRSLSGDDRSRAT
ncbi:nicotinate phosphoribosyltransferase [Tautonia plasticadhaerens]|uniref:Nicotinate phosphoribosyltransferase n=1 Tax=Tautonia plasticadhaerens TaxID=2527974 RepID=A0A518GVW2_9BACT|nr:nicotinate phosphoribosyltransferase [Tautonia plasticadhaerens]QDV32691.1 Nicotinate phosphoribosyltransferase pncB2 [Tautonia plasticadhaerens]